MPTVLITGTSTGFGRVTTEVLAARGWRVFATMRDLKRKDPLERALRNAGLSDRVTFVQLDVTDAAAVNGGRRETSRRGPVVTTPGSSVTSLWSSTGSARATTQRAVEHSRNAAVDA
jgi:NAD(P)-dependent dehydrogenase (short-subunit alcohol dehydrogenase family)